MRGNVDDDDEDGDEDEDDYCSSLSTAFLGGEGGPCKTWPYKTDFCYTGTTEEGRGDVSPDTWECRMSKKISFFT